MTAPLASETRILSDFASDAARLILECARNAIAERGTFRIALAGGETPAGIYARMAELAEDLPWQRVQFTFGDERCVAPSDAQSNYRMAKQSLFDRAGIAEGNVFRVRGELPPEEAALEYEGKLAAFAGRLNEARYVHDLVLLGLGPDGHTASLFPGSPALDEVERNVIPTIGPKPPPQRITMTFPLLNAARQVFFLVNDAAKQPVIDDILAGRNAHPAGKIRPTHGQVTWLIGRK
jgi:6-phosphogluconolactonase